MGLPVPRRGLTPLRRPAPPGRVLRGGSHLRPTPIAGRRAPHQVEVLAGHPGHHLVAGHADLAPRATASLCALLELEHQVGQGRVDVTEIVDLTLGGTGRPSAARPAQLTLRAGVLSPRLPSANSAAGKELVARALHERSPRRAKPFIAVNCSALAETLLESELFGHEKGSFTGASKDTKGVFEAADGGTLFLDEVGDMPLSTQVRLLRAVQQGEIKPVGSSASIKVDVRIVAATNVDLKRAITEGGFREDLFYRLNVVPIPIPPLRERPEDIPLLAYEFLKKQCARHDKGSMRFDPEALQALCSHAWPGNVRELENLVERVVILCQKEVVTRADFPSDLGGGGVGVREYDQTTLAHLPFSQAKLLSLRAFERRYLSAVLERNGGVISVAARAAGVDLSNFRRLLKQAEGAAGVGEGDADEVAAEV